MYDVNIHVVLNGYEVKVGCQTLVFNSLNEFLAELRSYLENPEETEKRYRKEAINAKFTLNPVPTDATPYAVTFAGNMPTQVGGASNEFVVAQPPAVQTGRPPSNS